MGPKLAIANVDSSELQTVKSRLSHSQLLTGSSQSPHLAVYQSNWCSSTETCSACWAPQPTKHHYLGIKPRLPPSPFPSCISPRALLTHPHFHLHSLHHLRSPPSPEALLPYPGLSTLLMFFPQVSLEVQTPLYGSQDPVSFCLCFTCPASSFTNLQFILFQLRICILS